MGEFSRREVTGRGIVRPYGESRLIPVRYDLVLDYGDPGRIMTRVNAYFDILATL